MEIAFVFSLYILQIQLKKQMAGKYLHHFLNTALSDEKSNYGRKIKYVRETSLKLNSYRLRMTFDDVTRFRAKLSGREENAWELG